MSGQTSCEYCSNYIFDEDEDDYDCVVSMDEDDVARMAGRRDSGCSYFQFDDEYKIVRRQDT